MPQPDHELWTSRPTGISANMALPLIIFKCNPNQKWRNDRHTLGFNPYQNIETVSMNLDANIQSDSWASAERNEWGTEVGTVVVARADRKAITPQQAETIATYCLKGLQPIMEGR
jgi:hypothetical protein